ncbi:MAG: hypothetical protein VYC42_16045 [Pseudomonadota bacterium]|nr:hypothetical protein [Nevskiales bacterium]MEC9364730.1 hypothetical protein [Pseudomonadota bacterium]
MSRALWVVLLVITSLLPWRAALACVHEAAMLQERCCCQELRARCPHVETGIGPCCTAVLAAPSQLVDADPETPPTPDSGKVAPPRPAIVLRPLAPYATRALEVWLDPLAVGGGDTYLRTARLRL